jgi:hypothetical protein
MLIPVAATAIGSVVSRLKRSATAPIKINRATLAIAMVNNTWAADDSSKPATFRSYGQNLIP